MKHKLTFSSVLGMAFFLALAPAALACTWYVDGVNGNDNNNCKTAQTACQTIGHAISLAKQNNSIKVAAATYTENLTISFSLKIVGSGATTTIIDGGGKGTVVATSGTNVTLSKLTIRNGSADAGGGINNSGTLTINNSIISGNAATGQQGWSGGGIFTSGNLTINNSNISNNTGRWYGGGIFSGSTLAINKSTVSGNQAGYGSGIMVGSGAAVITNSTVSGNRAGIGGGIFNNYMSTVTITNSTISNNDASGAAGGIFNSLYGGPIAVNNSTLSGNSSAYGGAIFSDSPNPTTLQNTVVANSPSGGNCFTDYGATITSIGYNLSSDNTCGFNNTGDMNNTDPKLGQLRTNGGPTQTIRLLPGSPAIDAGNPNGCTDDQGHLLTTDQRGWPRPGKDDTGGCDMGAFERQKD